MVMNVVTFCEYFFARSLDLWWVMMTTLMWMVMMLVGDMTMYLT